MNKNKHVKYCILFRVLAPIFVFFSYVNSCVADQDDYLVGKTFWVYNSGNDCHRRLAIYKNTITNANEKLALKDGDEILINDKKYRPINFDSSYWYEIKIKRTDEVGYITFNDLNTDYGAFKKIYISNGGNVDKYDLVNTCILDLSPDQKTTMIQSYNLQEVSAQNAVAEKRELERQEKKRLIAAERQAEEARKLERKEELKLQREAELKERAQFAPSILSKLSTFDFCVAYGNFSRGEAIADVGDPEWVKEVIEKEKKKRGLSINKSHAKDTTIKLGMSLCQLYASWGYPKSETKSVGNWGLHIQHVYSANSQFVYSENGKISSWQSYK